MKDIRKVNYKPHDPKSDWVYGGYYTSVIPILKQPGKSFDDTYGTAFLIKCYETIYVVTAKHVVDIDNPTLLFAGTKKSNIFLETEYFNKIGIDWICHKSEDLAILPLKIPELIGRIINTKISPNKTSVNIQPNQIVKHLGYPDKMTGYWTDTNKQNTIPSGISGRIIKVFQNKIIIDTVAHKGDSGGPLFLKIANMAKLIGVILKTKILKNDVTNEHEMYLGETTAISMSSVYSMLLKK